MDLSLITILLFAGLLLFLATGAPLVMVMGGGAVIFSYLLWGPQGFLQVAANSFGVMQNFILVAIPLFIFMGIVLEQSGLARALYEMMYRWFGGLRGGLAAGTVIICMIFAAMCGVSGAATVSMGMIALPSMLERRYDKDIAIGSISAGGALGILIPPSIPFILYGLFSGESIGSLFASGILPGILLGCLFIIYILVRSYFQKGLGPALPKDKRATWKEKIVSLRAVALPMVLIALVLGSIFGGIATPTEAAAIGALGSLVCAAVSRSLSWKVIRESCQGTLRLSCMVVWIIIGGTAFTSLYTAIGAVDFIREVIAALSISRYIILFGMEFVLFVLGMLLDPGGIIMICTPVFVPVIKALGFDAVWFGLLFIINMEMAYLTPPFGFNLFYMKAIVPKHITMGDIIHSILPFTGIQAITLIICIIFPEIATWLPHKLLSWG
jgi:tripartite ATP-independent transporter DctM subunit